jgi:protein-tyrosine phosphatase
MKIMFVCTGNICRSPMGELLMAKYLEETSLEITSAGTHGLIDHPIDPSSGKLMESVGIDPSRFRSKRLTKTMAESADLILCFEKRQRTYVARLAPLTARRTFLLTEFNALSSHAHANKTIVGSTIQDRLDSVITSTALSHPMPQEIREIDDPHGKDFATFYRTAEQTNDAIYSILDSLKP